MNFYPFHIGDYASHTRHLNLIEDLAYRRLMDAYYLAETPFSGEIKSIAKEIGMEDYISEVEYVLKKYFQFWASDLTWRNKRADEEIAKYHAKADSARNANRVKLEKKSILKPVLKSEADQTLTKNQEPRTNNQLNIKTPDGVSDSVWKDYKKLRDKHKAPITETALNGLIREAKAANMPLEDVMVLCCERGWRGFKAEWVKQEAIKAKEMPLGTEKQIEEAYRIECGGDPTQARFNSYFEMKKFILDQRDKRARA